MNPFVEYIRAALEMVTKGFTYESVFSLSALRHVRNHQGTGGSAGKLCAGTWNQGWQKWSEKWVRTYRIMKDGDIQVLNEYRERFVTEVEALAQGFSSGKKESK